jgi:cellulose synthase/poly-beta-1,6-N-acetylglucosamine synthase-like glycosyltransferase
MIALEPLPVLVVISAVLVVYHHVIYPLLLRSLGGLVRQPPARNERPELPTVTIIVPAFNEERWIADKIANIACLDYPEDRLEVIVACDGCTDRTAEIARRTAEAFAIDHLVEVRDDPVNRGKLARINEVTPRAAGEIVALSDVSALVSIDALQLAARHFADPEIGVVASRYILAEAGSAGEADYWSYQARLREAEASIAGAIGASGAFFAFRRALFRPLPVGTINDDFVLPMQIVARGYRAVLDTTINAIELEPTDLVDDWRRRVRIGAGNLQQSLWFLHLLNPARPALGLVFFSGKWLRPFLPLLMLTAFAGSIFLAPHSPLFMAAALGQGALYLIAFAVQLRPRAVRSRVFLKLHYLVYGHAASLVGAWHHLNAIIRRPAVSARRA